MFLAMLERMIPRKRWICHAWCVMTTHYHLLLTTREANLGRRPEDWRWSSYTHLVERRVAPAVSIAGLIEHFGGTSSPVDELVRLVKSDVT